MTQLSYETAINNHIHHYFNGSILIVEPVFMVIAGLIVGLLCGSVLTLEDRQQTYKT